MHRAECGLFGLKLASNNMRDPKSDDQFMTASSFKIVGNVVDILGRRTYRGGGCVENGRIAAITSRRAAPTTYLLPGFIDAHVHIESSMLVPSELRGRRWCMGPWRR